MMPRAATEAVPSDCVSAGDDAGPSNDIEPGDSVNPRGRCRAQRRWRAQRQHRANSGKVKGDGSKGSAASEIKRTWLPGKNDGGETVNEAEADDSAEFPDDSAEFPPTMPGTGAGAAA